MPHGPFLIFDKSSLESLNLDEAVMLDNFYMSNITPLFFVECLADLEKAIRSNSTPEQLVGSLATRTPESQSYPNLHHATILRGELAGKFDLKTVHSRVVLAGGRHVQLGDKKGVIFEHSPEAEAVSRWSKREFLELERNIARQWRRALTSIDLNAMAQSVATALGPWRKPNSLQDALTMTDTIIDNMDSEWLIRFGLNLVGAPETVEYVVNTWVQKRRPQLREHLPYFVFMLKINIFFCLVLPTQLLSKVKPSHKIDLAYLYYLPFCSVFTSKDNFHADIVPLFLSSEQTFVNGAELKEDLKSLVAHYEQLPADVLKTGLIHFAAYPPDDAGFLTTRLWDKYLPDWRRIRDMPKPVSDPEEEKRLVEEINRQTDSPELQPSDEQDIDRMDYATIRRMVHPQKGRWLRFSEDQIQRILEHEKNKT
ncbi:MAG TPA: hypothetical protein VMJ93_11300 [Verrucomicrobiae bacterium]|nr:hypothetical protein [Verrucomicrobiae bacterium]